MFDSDDVAIVHDYLTQRGGAERVVVALARAFPEAPIYTSMYQLDSTFPEFGESCVHTTPLQYIPTLARHHRRGLFLYPWAFSRLIVQAKVAICSTSGWAHGCQVTGAKILYVHNPARWLYQQSEYLGGKRTLASTGLRLVNRQLRSWDIAAARSADAILTNSHLVRERIHRTWDLDAHVVYPPRGIEPDGVQEPIEGVDAGCLLTIARLLPYKNVDSIVEAMRFLPNDQLVVVGEGPMRRSLAASAPTNVLFVGSIGDAQLRWLLTKARLLICAGNEDLGLAPVEGLAFGTPSVALAAGGHLETVVEGKTGLFFSAPSAKVIAAAVREADIVSWDMTRLRAQADLFDPARFASRVRSVVERWIELKD